jgi:hypothetical protein
MTSCGSPADGSVNKDDVRVMGEQAAPVAAFRQQIACYVTSFGRIRSAPYPKAKLLDAANVTRQTEAADALAVQNRRCAPLTGVRIVLRHSR